MLKIDLNQESRLPNQKFFYLIQDISRIFGIIIWNNNKWLSKSKLFFFPSKLCIFFLFISNQSSNHDSSIKSSWMAGNFEFYKYHDIFKWIEWKKNSSKSRSFLSNFFSKILCSLSKLRSSRILHQTKRTYHLTIDERWRQREEV